MKNIFIFSFLIFSFYTGSAQSGWVQMANFPGGARYRAAYFSLASQGRGYMVGGTGPAYYTDAFAYDTATNSWSQIASYPDSSSDGKVGFSIDTLGYVGLGVGNHFVYSRSFYQYSPRTNNWIAIDSFPGEGRAYSVAFVINSKAYVGAGLNGYYVNPLSDFYSYDALTSKWTQTADYPGAGDAFCVAFGIGNKGYVGTGAAPLLGNLVPQQDFWEYDPSSDKWTKKANCPNGVRAGAVAFTICNNAYIGSGYFDKLQTDFMSDFWKYNQSTDKWTGVADCGGYERGFAVAFSFGGPSAYVGSGCTYVYQGIGLINDFWKFRDPASVGITSNKPGICVGDSITFTGTSNFNATSWTWAFPGGTPAVIDSSTASVTYNQSGTYIETESVSNGCSVLMNSDTITVNPPPVVSFSNTLNGLQAGFHANVIGGAKSYAWHFGDGSSSASVSPLHTYDSAGTYHVCLEVSNANSCTTTECRDVVVSAVPHCSAYFVLRADSTTPHHWFAINETNGLAPITYNWQWGDGTSGIGDTASHRYASAGFYTICLSITDDSACRSAYCDSSAYLFRMDGSNTMVSVNVVDKSVLTGVAMAKVNAQNNLLILPNPCTTCQVKGIENVNDVVVTDMLGRRIDVLLSKASGGYTIGLPPNRIGMFLLRNIITGQVVKFVKE